MADYFWTLFRLTKFINDKNGQKLEWGKLILDQNSCGDVENRHIHVVVMSHSQL